MKKGKTAAVLACALGISAAFWNTDIQAFGMENGLYRLVDEADPLTDSEEDTLNEMLDEISDRQQCDVVIVTENSLDGKNEAAYADDFFDYNGYGFGENNDGILLLVSMEERKWAISTTGYGIEAFTDTGQAYISDRFTPYLSDGDYEEAFICFAELCDDFLTQARTEEPYDTDNLPKEAMPPVFIPLAILAGAVIAFIITAVMKAQLKSVRRQPEASSYVKKGSMRLTDSRDMFLYSTVTRTAKPKDTGSGGSSTHTGSSGTTHGGSSGSF